MPTMKRRPLNLCLLLWLASWLSSCQTSSVAAPASSTHTAHLVTVSPTVSPPTMVAPTTTPPASPSLAPPTAIPTRATIPAPTSAAPTAGPAATAASSATRSGPAVQWSETQRNLTAGLFVDPTPVQLGSQTTFMVVLNDASGQPVTDASVELTVTGGMQGMEGEHDEDFPQPLAHQGNGQYTAQASVGGANLVLTSMGLRIQRGGQQWAFVIPKDALSSP